LNRCCKNSLTSTICFWTKKAPGPLGQEKKLRWVDSFGNGHELDYVLERGGASDKVGTPVAFIESAWRRYTKHSRNKAQEIQGAVLPLAVKHHFSSPMLGCILAGVYTGGALDQLKSVGFKVLYFSYESVIEAFASVGVDAHSDESTPDADFGKKLKKWKRLSREQKISVGTKLLELNTTGVEEFMRQLERTVQRQITSIRITPLHGCAKTASQFLKRSASLTVMMKRRQLGQ
jgi:hypothetical protein